MDPIFWLGLSILLVAISIAAVLLAMIPALKELSRAAQGAEKLFETLNRELPPTLEAIRLTSLELTELTDDMSDGIQGVGQVFQQVDSSITTAKVQAQQVTVTTKSLAAGFKAAWQTFTSETTSPPSSPSSTAPAAQSPEVAADAASTAQNSTEQIPTEQIPTDGFSETATIVPHPATPPESIIQPTQKML